MRSISYWARYNPRTARFFIVIIKGILIFLAAYAGILFSKMQVTISPLALLITVMAAILISILYPQKKKNKRPGFYLRQKLSDFLLAACSFVCFTSIANNLESVTPSSFNLYANVPITNHTAKQVLSSLSYRDKNSLSRLEKRILKKEFNHQLGVYAKSKLRGNNEKAEDAALIILTIVAALGLMALLAMLVCNLSCGGADAAAVLVGILGTAAIVWGVVVVIKRINRKSKKIEKDAAAPPA
jgi:O-antigen/teichoic acid export membrane protein